MVSESDSESIASNHTEYLFEQNFQELRSEALKSKKFFEDSEFLPQEEFLRERSKHYGSEVVWLRPHDIVRPDLPILVSNKNEGFDIRQGMDGWYVPAFSAISDSDALLRHVIPPDQGFSEAENYAGIFHFRFWFGRWIEIVIDDLLPTRRGNLIYMQSASRVEFWPALLEKAYAKAKGTYELLNNWLPIDACIELTGGCPERVKNISRLLSGEQKQIDRLFADILRANQNGNIPLVSFHAKTPSNANRQQDTRSLGLEPRYVYRITQVADLGQGRQIIRIKNCSGWTNPQWTGSWSPDDASWLNVSDSVRRELDGEAFHDGGFWIGVQDFLRHFDNIDFCHINKETDKEAVFNGRWEVGSNAGGVQKGDFKNYAKNPQCFIELKSPNPEDPDKFCSAVISLMQRRQQASKVKGVNKIGFRIYRVDREADELTSQFFSYRRNDGRHKAVTKTPTWQDGRESNIRVRLPVGRYCIVPSTYMPDMEGDFILRVHIESFGPEVEMEDSSDSDTFICINNDPNETTALVARSATPTFSERSVRSELKFGNQRSASRTTSVQGSRSNLARYKPLEELRSGGGNTPIYGSRRELGGSQTSVYGRPEGRATPIYGSTSGRGSNLYGSRSGVAGRTTPLYGSKLDLHNSKK